MKTRFEQIKEMSVEDMTEFFCHFLQEFTDDIYDYGNINIELCNYCPASKFCDIGHTGFEDWLKEEADADPRR